MEMNSMSIDGCSQSQQAAAAAAASAISRWNPTKEQINMLEDLYKQGIRTPSAEQIQQITSKLKVTLKEKKFSIGFKTTKQDKRQKQKQETNLLYFNRFLHKPTTTVVNPSVFIPSPISPPPYNNNVICNQFYIPTPLPSSQANIGYYHQYPITNKVPLPAVWSCKEKIIKNRGDDDDE